MNSKSDFIKTALSSLSQERFNDVVEIFEKSYLKNEVVFVDGHGDGGCDIKIFKNRREEKRCIQITTNKSIKQKLYDDLSKVDALITKYGYSSKFEFFCSCSLADDKINEYKKFANAQYSIDLEIYDGNRLAQLDCPELTEYIFSQYKNVIVKPEEFNLNSATKILYQMLASGKDTVGIKNSIIFSIVVSVLYEKGTLSMKELSDEVSNRIKRQVDLSFAVSVLSQNSRVDYDNENDSISLTPDEKDSIENIIATASIIENDFLTRFSSILSSYGISDNAKQESILNEIKKLYSEFYSSEFATSQDTEHSGLSKEFREKLEKLIDNALSVDSLFDEIKQLCDDNSYLNRISVSESFFNLYQSNQLVRYLSQKNKNIFLDTPAIVYFLLSKCSDMVVEDWNDPDYKSVCSLVNLINDNEQHFGLYVYSEYLQEVAWELKKALKLSWLDDCPYTDALGETSNNFYNYYHYMKSHEFFEIDENLDTLEDFVSAMGFDKVDVDSPKFIYKTIQDLKSILEDYGVVVEERPYFDNYTECKVTYEKLLMLKGKDKTQKAISNDVSQILYLLTDPSSSNDEDLFFATWDTSLYWLRDELLDNDERSRYSYFYISNPAKLSNRIALENFNIDKSAITSDIFMYADKEYDLSKRIRTLREIIAPLLENKTGINRKLVKGLNSIRKQQLNADDGYTGSDLRNNRPVEDVFLSMMKSENGGKEYEQKFKEFISVEDHADYILKLIEDALLAKKQKKSFNFKPFYDKVMEFKKDASAN